MATAKLTDVLGAFDMAPDGWPVYLNRKTGESHMITEDDDCILRRMDHARMGDLHIPEWQRESIIKGREIREESGDWIMLPPKADFHEYAVMEAFSQEQPDEALQELLLTAIQGKGAFRRFKDVIHRKGLQDAWHKRRDQSLAEFLAEWLKSRGIEFNP